MIPRATVAAALGLPDSTEALPAGDLPLDRFAARYVAYLGTADPNTETPDAWTGAVMDHLIQTDPQLALEALLAGLPVPGADRLADPLAELGPTLSADVLETLANENPAFAALIETANTPE